MSTHRHVYDVPLAPVLGSTFQPTGFPDLGAATFDRWDGDATVPSLLVESVQSMANRLEATAWEDATDRPVAEISALPYVRVVRKGTDEFLTSSRLEAHRLASPFVFEAALGDQPMDKVISDRLGLAKDTPLNYGRMAHAVAELDPFCLLHGVFFSRKNWIGQPKFPRAVSGVIEAQDVRRAVSGGRKSDRVRHQLGEGEGGTSEGYGSVPFHRVEWTAKSITASFSLDLELLRSYGLPSTVTALLETLALWEIRTLLDRGLRLRTACDLEVAGAVTTRRGKDLPPAADLDEQVRAGVRAFADAFEDVSPLTVQWG